jgi:hypothetical protein
VSGNSKGEPNATNQVFKPSKEVESKMRPLTANTFNNLLRRAATQPVPPSVPKAK